MSPPTQLSVAQVRSRTHDACELVENQHELSCFLALSRTNKGCRRVQEEIENAGPGRLCDIADKFRGHLLELVECRSGNFVLQKLIKNATRPILQWMVVELSGTASWLAQSKTGCRSFLRLLEHDSREQVWPLVEELLLLLVDCAENRVPDHVAQKAVFTLCSGPFSNYVVQMILEQGSDIQQQWIGYVVAMHVEQLCLHQHGASVVCKALVHCSGQERLMLNSALHEITNNEWRLESMARHRHGHETLEELRRLHLQHDLPDESNLCQRLSQTWYVQLLAVSKQSKREKKLQKHGSRKAPPPPQVLEASTPLGQCEQSLDLGSVSRRIANSLAESGSTVVCQAQPWDNALVNLLLSEPVGWRYENQVVGAQVDQSICLRTASFPWLSIPYPTFVMQASAAGAPLSLLAASSVPSSAPYQAAPPTPACTSFEDLQNPQDIAAQVPEGMCIKNTFLEAIPRPRPLDTASSMPTTEDEKTLAEERLSIAQQRAACLEA